MQYQKSFKNDGEAIKKGSMTSREGSLLNRSHIFNIYNLFGKFKDGSTINIAG